MSVLVDLAAASFATIHSVASFVDAAWVISCFMTTEPVSVCVLLSQQDQLKALCCIHFSLRFK